MMGAGSVKTSVTLRPSTAGCCHGCGEGCSGRSLATYLQYVNATAPMIHSATADVVQRIHEHRLTADAACRR